MSLSHIKRHIILSLLVLLAALMPWGAATVMAAAPTSQADCAPGTVFRAASQTCETEISPGDLPKAGTGEGAIKTILSIAFAIIGALSVLMITVSGMRYIVSAGDPQKAAKARNGIIYALVGLAVALSAEAIVAFVAERL